MPKAKEVDRTVKKTTAVETRKAKTEGAKASKALVLKAGTAKLRRPRPSTRKAGAAKAGAKKAGVLKAASLVGSRPSHASKAPALKPEKPRRAKSLARSASAKPRTQASASAVATPEHPVSGLPMRPGLPETYGESRLLLLARDPQTLFAMWDMDPAVADELKSRIGSRAFAVSTLTLRVTATGGGTSVVHVGRSARSRYLKVAGAPSFSADIGFTTPSGRFEFVARSAPCLVPLEPEGGRKSADAPRRSVLGYREARALARRGLLFSSLRQAMQQRSMPADATATLPPGSSPGMPSKPSASSTRPTSLTSRVLGGASDRYRR